MAIGYLNEGTLGRQHWVCVLYFLGDLLLLMLRTVYAQANKLPKAMVAHEKALEWQELFDLAMEAQLPDDEITAMAYRMAGTFPRREQMIVLCPNRLLRGLDIEEKICRCRSRVLGLHQEHKAGHHCIG